MTSERKNKAPIMYKFNTNNPIINLTPHSTITEIANTSISANNYINPTRTKSNNNKLFSGVLSNNDVALQTALCMVTPLNVAGQEATQKCMETLQNDILSSRPIPQNSIRINMGNPTAFKNNLKK